MKRTEVVELIKETLRRIAPGAKTILYGSGARGEEIAYKVSRFLRQILYCFADGNLKKQDYDSARDI